MDRKCIMDEFLIDYKVFLLKPAKTANIYFIERLASIDINGEELSK